MQGDNSNIDGQTLTAGDRIGFYLTTDGKIKSLPADYDGQTPPSDAEIGGTYRVVPMDEGESRILAIQMESIKSVMQVMDWDYMATALVQLREMANRYDSTAVLNRNYRPEQGDLFFAQSEAMRLLFAFRGALLKCDDLKRKSEEGKKAFDRISAALGG